MVELVQLMLMIPFILLHLNQKLHVIIIGFWALKDAAKWVSVCVCMWKTSFWSCVCQNMGTGHTMILILMSLSVRYIDFASVFVLIFIRKKNLQIFVNIFIDWFRLQNSDEVISELLCEWIHKIYDKKLIGPLYISITSPSLSLSAWKMLPRIIIFYGANHKMRTRQTDESPGEMNL